MIYTAPFREDSRASRALLRQAAGTYLGRPTEGWTITEAYRGKPSFQQAPGLGFSVSHSGDWWMCAFGEENLGLDLQRHQNCSRADLSAKFFAPEEDSWLRARDWVPFFDLWSAKESYIKYTGMGITEGLDYFSVVSPEGRFPAMSGVQLRLIPWREGYSLCLCARELREIRFCSLF